MDSLDWSDLVYQHAMYTGGPFISIKISTAAANRTAESINSSDWTPVDGHSQALMPPLLVRGLHQGGLGHPIYQYHRLPPILLAPAVKLRKL